MLFTKREKHAKSKNTLDLLFSIEESFTILTVLYFTVLFCFRIDSNLAHIDFDDFKNEDLQTAFAYSFVSWFAIWKSIFICLSINVLIYQWNCSTKVFKIHIYLFVLRGFVWKCFCQNQLSQTRDLSWIFKIYSD